MSRMMGGVEKMGRTGLVGPAANPRRRIGKMRRSVTARRMEGGLG